MAWAGPDTLPEAMKKRIARGPEAYLAQMTRLIGGFGGVTGLKSEGIARYVAVERAAARADALRELLVADLDADGTVTAAEAEGVMQVLSARGRGGFLLTFTVADADGDGRAGPQELQAAADRAAEARLGDAAAAQLQAVLVFDADGDAAVSLRELQAGVAQLAGKS
ncbi:hypothetical protein [Gemmobacter aquatilis]|nr:hypothetical protein [Gemmobacter aquatilis]